MIAQAAKGIGTVLLFTVAGCAPYTKEVHIEMPAQAQLDVSAFHRVLIPGFITAGTDEINISEETVRLLRGSLRSRSSLKVIDADILPLADMAKEQAMSAGVIPADQSQKGKSKADEEGKVDEHIFSDAGFWKKLGEEYQEPLILTGIVVFASDTTIEFADEQRDASARVSRRSFLASLMQHTSFMLKSKFILIDGRTGAIVYSETLQERVSSNPRESVAALSSYFELMSRVTPKVAGLVSNHKVTESRVLLK